MASSPVLIPIRLCDCVILTKYQFGRPLTVNTTRGGSGGISPARGGQRANNASEFQIVTHPTLHLILFQWRGGEYEQNLLLDSLPF